MRRACVYTILTGGYEELNPQPAAARSRLRFICLTDDHRLKPAAGWEIRHTPLPLPGDPIRSQRMMKILPHKFLPEFAASLYIDNTVKLLAPPEAVFAAAPDAALALCRHSFHSTLLQEFHAVVAERLDHAARVAEQRRHYEASTPALLHEPVLWTGLLLRRHNVPELRRAMDLWCAHMLRYSRRDQLSITMALHLAGFEPHLLNWDNFSSAFHSWPHLTGRQLNRRHVGAPQSEAGKIAELEANLAAMRDAYHAAETALAAHGAAPADGKIA